MAARARAVVRVKSNGYGDDYRVDIPEGREATSSLDDHDDDKYDHHDQYQHNNNNCCWFGGWGFWRWLVVINTIAVIVMIVLYIILISNHGWIIETTKLDKNIPIGQRLKYVPQSVKLQASQTKFQTKSYKFNLNGVFARYPADGGVIEGLKEKMKGRTEFCCNYEVKMQNRSLVKQACASTTTELKFQIKTENNEKDGYMIVSAKKNMVGAQCTLTWTINEKI